MILTITIPGKTPNLNSLYVTSKCGRYRFLSKEAQTYKTQVKKIMNGVKFEIDKKTHGLEVEAYFYIRNIFTKTGSNSEKSGSNSEKSGDIDGFLKCSIDAIFANLEIDDSAICKLTVYKLESDQDMSTFLISPMLLKSVKRKVIQTI